jgi:hypothetical protein
MAKFNNAERRFAGRIVAVVPGVSGNYANERVTVQAVGAAQGPGTITEITALAEAPFVAGTVVELWLARWSDGVNAITDNDYTLAGSNFPSLTAAGAQRWSVSGWHLAQVRVKSGSVVGGSQGVTVTAL